ncbi:hypothetical protein V6N13_005791 [Hibiscus sabdariffa]|uniref:Uncharacterized protein n=1 Tax=Hibiscus sabdariffa TaxID=183260 RepID=A0ABR2EQ67_9ROSI
MEAPTRTLKACLTYIAFPVVIVSPTLGTHFNVQQLEFTLMPSSFVAKVVVIVLLDSEIPTAVYALESSCSLLISSPPDRFASSMALPLYFLFWAYLLP